MTTQTSEEIHYITVDEAQSGQRLDNFLIRHLKGVPKSRVYRLIRKGECRVNKRRAKQDYRLQINDLIRIPPVLREVAKKPTMLPKRLEQLLIESILYEDEALLIINKPAGIAVHGGSGISFGIIEGLRQIFSTEKHLELVHRLDRDTSGCLMVAKKRSQLKILHELLRNRAIEKQYLCLVPGHWPAGLNKVELPLRKFVLQSGERMVKVDQEQGKPAITHFQVEQHFGKDFTLVSAFPVTGKTHQIRVHTKAVGFPIMGDEKYGDAETNKMASKIYGLPRLFLHAYKLKLVFPNQPKFSVEAALPTELQEVVNRLAKKS